MAFVMPIVGLILGIIAAAKHEGPGTNHGMWVILASAGGFVFWLAVWSGGA